MSAYLYRLYDAQDQLLYIGISKSAIKRLHDHLAKQPWSEQIAKQTIEQYPTRKDAEQAERELIKSEKPLHNVFHNKKRDPAFEAQEMWQTLSQDERAQVLLLLRNVSVALGQLPDNTDKDQRLAAAFALGACAQDAGSDFLNWSVFGVKR